MAHDEAETVVVEEPQPRWSKTTLMLMILSALLVASLVMMVAGGFLYVKKTRGLQAEVVAVKKDLQEKVRLHDNLKEQIESLSQQISVLKQYSVARSGAEQSKEMKEDMSRLPGDTKAGKAGSDEKNESSPAQIKEVANTKIPMPKAPAIPPKIKRPSTEGQSCDLMGKSAEAQSAILKRCVDVMNGPAKTKAASK